MPKYFFDSNDGQLFRKDAVGLLLTDRYAARTSAMDVLPEVAREVMPDGDFRVMAVLVREEEGPYFFEATLTLKSKWLAG